MPTCYQLEALVPTTIIPCAATTTMAWATSLCHETHQAQRHQGMVNMLVCTCRERRSRNARRRRRTGKLQHPPTLSLGLCLLCLIRVFLLRPRQVQFLSQGPAHCLPNQLLQLEQALQQHPVLSVSSSSSSHCSSHCSRPEQLVRLLNQGPHQPCG